VILPAIRGRKARLHAVPVNREGFKDDLFLFDLRWHVALAKDGSILGIDEEAFKQELADH